MVRLVLAEDHNLIRDALRRLIGASGRIQLVAEASSSEEVIPLVARTRPDVLALDINMPGQDAITTIVELANLGLPTKVLALSMGADDAPAIRAVQVGAAGFINKAATVDELVSAVQAVHEGKRVVPADAEDLLTGSPHPTQVLSPREFQVLSYLASGMTNREIAQVLAISVKTVDTHRGHVLKKLKLRNNSDLTRFAIQNGLLQT